MNEGECCKVLLSNIDIVVKVMELVLVYTCASSCGKTGEADVIHRYWV